MRFFLRVVVITLTTLILSKTGVWANILHFFKPCLQSKKVNRKQINTCSDIFSMPIPRL
jgi:hypothetical protein